MLMGKQDDEALPSKFYAPNKAFDKNNDGKITRGEIVTYVKRRHERGAQLKG